MNQDFLNSYLENKRSVEESAKDVIQGVSHMLDDLGIERLGLWAFILSDAGTPDYKGEDKKLFADIEAPDVELGFGEDEDYSDGFIFGVEKYNDTIVFVGFNNETNKVVRFQSSDVIDGCYDIDFDDIVAAIRNTVQINTEHKIPMDKWCVAHYVDAGEYTVDPYTWEPIKKTQDDSLLKYSGAESLAHAFSELTTETLDLSSLDMSNVQALDYMCAMSKFRRIIFPTVEANNLTSMDNTFVDCEDLTEIDFNGFTTPNLYCLLYGFNNCRNIKGIDLSSLRSTSPVDISGAFCECNSLETLNLSNMECVLDFPFADEAEAFQGCHHLKTIIMQGCSESSIDTIKNALEAASIQNVKIVTA